MRRFVHAASFTLVDGESLATLGVAPAGDRISITPEDLRQGLGWELKDQGLCRGEQCVPVRERGRLESGGRIDVAELARLLDRPLAIDAEERTAVLGVAAADRRARLASLEAPDFTLPDLSGVEHTLSGHRGRKVLLIAWASW